MDINATLFGQMITFALFVWFTMRFVWPPIIQALEHRRAKIADGIAAAEAAQCELAAAQEQVQERLATARLEASKVIDEAHKQARLLVEEAKRVAVAEGQRLIQKAQAELAQQVAEAREQLRAEVANLALMGAAKVVGHGVDTAANQALLQQLIEEV